MEILNFINFQKGVLLVAKNNSNNSSKGMIFVGIIAIGFVAYSIYKSKKGGKGIL